MSEENAAKKPKKFALQKISQADIEKFNRERRGIESDFLADVLQSRKNAWTASKVSWLFSFALIGVTGFTIYRYSQPIVPPVITVNPDTNEVQQVSIMIDKMHYTEAMDRYWVGRFVVSHESYDWNSLQQDFDLVNLMSSESVGEEYRHKYTTEHLDKKLGDTEDTKVFIASIVIDQQHGQATVRYSTVRHLHSRDQPEPRKYFIAEMSYRYASFPMTAAQREINPLGFQVTSFRSYEESANHVGN